MGRDARTLRADDESIDEDLLFAELLAGTSDRVVREKRFVHRDGRYVAALSTAVLVQGKDGAPQGLLWHLESIDEQRRVENALLETQSVHDAIMTLDSKERVVAWNAGAERTFGWSRTEMLGQSARFLLPDRLRARYDFGPGVTGPSIFEHMESGGTVTEVVAQHKDGREFPVEVSHSLWQRKGQQWIIVITRDITERVALQAELLAQANTDPLTGAPTRGAFTRQLATLLMVSAPVSVIVFNLVRFSQLNTSLGPASGDQVLIEVGRRLQGALRPGDLYGRLGGDGFAVALPATTGIAALQIAGRLRALIHDRPVAGRLPVTVDVRAGIAATRRTVTEPHVAGSANRVLRNASLALSDAAPGAARLYRAELARTAHRRIRLHTALDNAVNGNKLEVAYQPQINLIDRQLSGVEALVRWNHAGLGSVRPDEFIPVAEDSDLIERLGAWVLDTACQTAVPWAARHPGFGLSVNLSGRQLGSDAIIDTVAKALAQSGLPGTSLTVEVTESVLMTDIDKVADRLTALTEFGVRVSVDDFGTGYSNLACLMELPIAELKIDRSFVKSLPDSSRAVKVITTILNLAASLELTTVAEGIETSGQDRILVELGCRTGQGYLFSRPVPSHEIDTLIAHPLHPFAPRLVLHRTG